MKPLYRIGDGNKFKRSKRGVAFRLNRIESGEAIITAVKSKKSYRVSKYIKVIPL